MKKIYTFTLNKTETAEELIIKKDGDGKEIKVLEKVEKKIPIQFFIRKSNSTLDYDCELFRQACYWDCIKKGILPMSQLQKRLDDDGGILNKEEQDWRGKSYEDLFNLQAEQKALVEKKDKTPEEDKELEVVFEKIVDVYTKINEFEQKRTNGLFQNTAENIASGRQAIWLTLYLSMKDLGGNKQEEVFPGKTFEDRLKVYDSLVDSDNIFDNELAERLFLACSLLNFGKASTQEDFELAIKVAENQGLIRFASSFVGTEKIEDTKEPVPPEVKFDIKLDNKAEETKT